MIRRNDKEKLVLNVVQLKDFLGGIFENAQTLKEVDFLMESIIAYTESIAEDMIERKDLQ